MEQTNSALTLMAGQTQQQVQQLQQLQSQPFYLPLTSSESNITSTPLPHFMPTPAPNWSIDTMPWKLKDSEYGSSGIIQFSGDTTLRRNQLHQKRKSEIMDAEVPPKQFISEEKITAHFNGLHISSDYIQNNNVDGINSSNSSMSAGKCFTNLSYDDYKITAKELEEKLRNANRITLCEELKQLQQQDRRSSYLPDALVNHIQMPCTALVLWQPPPPLVRLLKGNNNDKKVDDQQEKDIDNEQTMATEMSDIDINIDDSNDQILDNNNASNINYNYSKMDDMDEDL